MKHRLIDTAGSLLAMALMLMMIMMPVSAHEGREVGDYELEFGWQVEPAYAGVLNGPEITLSLADEPEGTPFPTDIDVNLQVEVTFGSDSATIALEQSGEEPGHFIATLVPTLPGDYTFRIFGTIGDTDVNETFSSADGEFSSVEPSTDILFPSSASLEARIAALEARLDELEQKLAGN